MDKHFRYTNYILLTILIIFLIDSFDQNFGFYLNRFYPEFYPYTFGDKNLSWREFIWDEKGIVETSQAIILFITLFLLIFFFFRVHTKKMYLKVFLLIEIIGIFYFLMEEISWGQHYFNFDTPGFIKEKNHQGEFNIHNISNLFNELPKSFVLLWCGFSFIFVKVIASKLNSNLREIILPKRELKIISITILIFYIPNFIIDKLGMTDYSKLYFPGINFKILLTMIFSFNFFRLSELHEFLFAYYFFWHTIFLKKKIINENSNNNY